ncbi:MAG: hypothetical protein ACO38P_03190 [Phycisphaerales bacterium]
MDELKVYEEDGDLLMDASKVPAKVVVVPSGDPRAAAATDRIRLVWGQHLLSDLLDGRYRTVVCGINDEDNTRGVLGELLKLIPTSQWTLESATSYAKMFRSAVAVHAAEDREPYVLKFDLDRLLILALMRPAGRDHFTLEDLFRGFRTVSKMLQGRRARVPAASVSFLGAKSNRLVDHRGETPSFEAVLDAMYQGGFTGDVYPPPGMWELGTTGVYPTFPFPESLDRMRQGSS